MQINRNNYGAFFLDYWESNLDEQGREALALFLEKNPDLQDEFFGFKAAVKTLLVAETQLTFPGKQRLKKIAVLPVGEITQDNFEKYIIAFLENDLTENQLNVFDRFRLANPEIENEIALYKKTYLKPDQRIVFQNKAGLKRRVLPFSKRQEIMRGLQIAALLLIAFGLFRLTTLLFTPEEENPKIAESTTSTPYSEQESAFVSEDKLKIRALDNLDGLAVLISDHPGMAPAPELRTSKTMHFEKHSDISGTGRQRPVFTHLPGRPAPSLLALVSDSYSLPKAKNEFSVIFDYLLVRDGLAGEKEDEKGFFGRLLAGLGNTLIKQREQPIDQLVTPVYTAVADRGKGLLSFASEALPVYQTIDETGRKETYFAINENFNILLSRSQTDD
jgi:hypothetical protein